MLLDLGSINGRQSPIRCDCHNVPDANDVPRAFFVIMSHLLLHLIEEFIQMGLVYVRWMCPIERVMESLKKHFKNLGRPEASIVYNYSTDEIMGFVTRYMHGYDVVKNSVWDADLEDCNEYEVLEDVATDFLLTSKLRDQAHVYVLQNNTLMAPIYRSMFHYYVDHLPMS